MKSSHFSREAQKRPNLPQQFDSCSYPTCDGESDCGATWSECGDTTQVLSAEEKVAVPEKINPFGLASIAAGIPPAAFACRAEARTHLRRAAAPNCASA